MDIKQIKITELKPYYNNPRKNDQAVSKVAESIQAFGFQNPIICDNKMVIIAGHTRWKAALQLKLESVPVIIADLPEEKAKAYRIADNRIGEFAEWDWEQLQVELNSIDNDIQRLLNFNFTEINEMDEWDASDMPKFDPGEKEIKLSIFFKTEHDRSEFVEKKGIEITSKNMGQWISRI